MAKNDIHEKVKSAYVDSTLTNGKRPETVYLFMKELKLSEADFYKYYSSFEALESSIWAGIFKITHETISSQEVYNSYSSREKILSFFFGLMETLKSNRSFVSFTFKQNKKIQFSTPYFLNDFKKMFENFAKEIIAEGINSGEIIDRKFISDKYSDALWLQLIFVINFWIDDHSKDFERTDEAIEKGLNVTFDLMATSPLDSMIEYGKFLFRNSAMQNIKL